jgi:hypothetical protein
MPSNQTDQALDADRAERDAEVDHAIADRVYAEALAVIAASYQLEAAGKRLNRQQRRDADKAARLARWLQAQAERGGRRP